MLKNQAGERDQPCGEAISGKWGGFWPRGGGRKRLWSRQGASCGNLELDVDSGYIIRRRKRGKRKETHMLLGGTGQQKQALKRPWHNREVGGLSASERKRKVGPGVKL